MAGPASTVRPLTSDAQRPLWRELALVFVVAVGVRFFWALIAPPWTTPDELSHFTYVSHIVENGEVPRTGPFETAYPDHPIELDESCRRTMCNRISALWLPGGRELQGLPLDFDFKQAREYAAPPLQRKSQSGSSASTYPAPYYALLALPYRALGEAPVLARLLAARFASGAISSLACCFGFMLAFELRGSRSWGRALGLTMALAPMPAFIGGSTNNDAMVMATATALCWLIARCCVTSTVTIGQAALVGLGAGSVLLSKPTAAPIVLVAGVVIAVKAFPVRLRPLRISYARLWACLSCLSCLVLSEGAWLLYKRITSPVAIADATTEGEALHSLLAAPKFGFLDYLHDLFAVRGLSYFYWLFIKSFWGLFGWQEIALSSRVYTMVAVVCAAAVVGAIIRLTRWPAERLPVLVMVSLVLAQVLFLFVVSDYFMGFAATGKTFGMQGRYFLPIIGPLLFVLIGGLQELAGEHPLLLRLLPLVMLAFQAVSVAAMMSAYYQVSLG